MKRKSYKKATSESEAPSGAKRRLDEGRFVGLPQDSSFDTTVERGGVDSSAENERVPEENHEWKMPEFESLDFSTLNELQIILDEMSSEPESQGWDGSDPDITGLLVGLVGEEGARFSNPFELAENVKRELISRAENAGSRALLWNLSHYDRIGGRGTLMSVWNHLKTQEKVGGVKRSLSSSSADDESELKKLKMSLNISDTCNRISEIELSLREEESLVVSFMNSSRMEEEWDRVNQASTDGGESLSGQEVGEVSQMNLVEVIPNYSDSESVSSSAFLSDNLRLTTGSESVPGLATTESESTDSNYFLSDRDSGMSDRRFGDVTNLSRRRQEHQILDGIVTETGPYVPVSLGIVGVGSDHSDTSEDGITGCNVRTRCFRLNVITGDTDLIDDETSRLLRECGVEDGINSRRYAANGEPVDKYDEDIEYQADESDISADEGQWYESYLGTSNEYEPGVGIEEVEDPVIRVERNAISGENCGNVLKGGEEEEEVPVMGKKMDTVGGGGGMEDPVMGNEKSRMNGENEYKYSGGGDGGVVEVPVEGNGKNTEGSGGDEECDMHQGMNDCNRMFVVVWSLLALIAVYMQLETLLNATEAVREVVTTDVDRVRDVNGAAHGGGSRAVSYPEYLQEALYVDDEFRTSGDVWVQAGMAGRNRIHDEQDIAIEDDSIEEILQVNQF